MKVSTKEQEKKSQSWFRRQPIWTTLLVVLGLLLIFLGLMAFLPVSVADTSVSNPAGDYDEAMARIDTIRTAEENSGDLNPVCYSNALTHGEKTEKVIIFYHGFTSCPEQFRELGEQFFDQGYNIYIPRMPHHGHADQLSDALIATNSEELAAFATNSTDIAQGLGDEVIAGGLSGGGTITTWIAQEKEDVDRAVMVAPFLGIGFIPTIINRPVARIMDIIPNIWMWWDPETKAENPETASYSYPRYPLHALAEYLRLGYAAHDNAQKAAPAVPSIVVITNANDSSVNNEVTAQIVDLWEAHGEEALDTFEFEKTFGLPHDIISPTREDGNPALVYPVIIDEITQGDQ